jgi:aspartate/methionine/tyrosine aminotransferase
MIQSARRIENYHYAIRHLAGVAEALTKTGREVIYLNIGDPQVYGFRPPPHIVEPVIDALRNSFTGYTHSAGLLEAREAVADYATRLGAVTAPDQVLITSGASEAADILLTALLNENDEVLLPAPGYPIYPAILSKLGATACYYHLDPANAWQPSLDEITSLVNSKTRALVLINPNNPTGSITSDEMTGQLLELALRHNLIVIADEVYRELCFAKPPAPSSVLAEPVGVPLVTLESLSKTFLVPGWRTGWLRFTHAEKMRDLVQAVYRLAGGRLCAPTPTQYAVRPALEGDRTFQLNFISELRKRRDFAVQRVQKIKGLSCDVPLAAFYLMIKVDNPGAHTDERFVLDLLEATGVLVVHGSGFGADPQQGYFRMVYLADEATLEIVFNRIGEFLESYRVRAADVSIKPGAYAPGKMSRDS